MTAQPGSAPDSLVRPGEEQPGDQGHSGEEGQGPVDLVAGDVEVDEAAAHPVAELAAMAAQDQGDCDRRNEADENGFAERHVRRAFRAAPR